MTMRNDVSLYIKQVLSNSPIVFRKKLKTDLNSNILDFLDENPNSTIGDVENFFGPAESFADEYILAMDATERSQTLARAKWIKNGILISLAIVILVIAVTAIWVIIQNSRSAGYCYETFINE